jgi:hypothetical protein
MFDPGIPRLNRSSPSRIIAAFLVLFLTVGAKIPSKLCHCHESKQKSSQEQAQHPCPFGALRGLVGTFIAAEPITIEPDLVAISSPSFCKITAIQSFELQLPQRCRSPPSEIS